MSSIKFEITKEDFEKAGEYKDVENCLMATVGKRVFKNKDLMAGGWHVIYRKFGIFRMVYKFTLDKVDVTDIYRDPTLLPVKGVFRKV